MHTGYLLPRICVHSRGVRFSRASFMSGTTVSQPTLYSITVSHQIHGAVPKIASQSQKSHSTKHVQTFSYKRITLHLHVMQIWLHCKMRNRLPLKSIRQKHWEFLLIQYTHKLLQQGLCTLQHIISATASACIIRCIQILEHDQQYFGVLDMFIQNSTVHMLM